MKTFDSPGDVKRAFQFLRKKTWEQAGPADKAMFLALIQNNPTSYGTIRTLTGAEVASDFFTWEWYKEPMDLGDRNDGSKTARKNYHDGGIKDPAANHLNGWFFVPNYVTLEFFDAARDRKAASITYVNAFLRGRVIDDTADPLNSSERAIGVANGADKERVHFLVDHQSEVLTDDRMATLFRTLLVAHTEKSISALTFKGFSNLIATDIVRVTMEGRSFYTPRFIEEFTVADD